MKHRAKQPRRRTNMSQAFSDTSTIVLFILFSTAFYLTISFTPLTKEDQIDRFQKMTEDVEPFRKNLTECARQVKASKMDVENFLKRIPQSSMQGKCFVACILKRNSIIKGNKILKDQLLDSNRAVYGEDSEVMSRLSMAIAECTKVVEGIFEVCDFASVFNDCMHMKMEHILDKLTMERRMQALGQMTADDEEWGAEEDEMLKLVKDEL